MRTCECPCGRSTLASALRNREDVALVSLPPNVCSHRTNGTPCLGLGAPRSELPCSSTLPRERCAFADASPRSPALSLCAVSSWALLDAARSTPLRAVSPPPKHLALTDAVRATSGLTDSVQRLLQRLMTRSRAYHAFTDSARFTDATDTVGPPPALHRRRALLDAARNTRSPTLPLANAATPRRCLATSRPSPTPLRAYRRWSHGRRYEALADVAFPPALHSAHWLTMSRVNCNCGRKNICGGSHYRHLSLPWP